MKRQHSDPQTCSVPCARQLSNGVEMTMLYIWKRSAHGAAARALASFVFLILGICDIWIESRITLPSTLIVRPALTVFGRLGVDAVLVL